MSREPHAVPSDPERVVAMVRERYAEVARSGGGCCGPAQAPITLGLGYKRRELSQIPPEADLGVGCGAPIEALALREGETVLDLGSGGGLDVFLAAREVGSKGRVIGVDMTPEMVARARGAAAKAGIPNVEFRHGRLEALPVADGEIDAVTSNCVINLVPDKARVFQEVARVLRRGGRMVVSDIVVDRQLPRELASTVDAYCGCLSGALLRADYRAAIEGAGLTDIEELRDFDYFTSWPEDRVEELCQTFGIRRAQIDGIVRSVTIRAVRP
jgi:arsenite methyltransferase